MALGMSAYGGRPVRSSMTVHPSDQMSDAVEAPLSSITSGATVNHPSKEYDLRMIQTRLTPVGSSSNIVPDMLHRMQVEGNTKVGQFNVAVLCSQNIGCFQVTVDHLYNCVSIARDK